MEGVATEHLVAHDAGVPTGGVRPAWKRGQFGHAIWQQTPSPLQVSSITAEQPLVDLVLLELAHTGAGSCGYPPGGCSTLIGR